MPMPIVTIPNAVLTTPAKTVSSFDKKLQKLIHEMEKTLIATKKPKGVGLAAPQIGEPFRVFITRPTTKDPIRAFVNAEIIAVSEIMDTEEEKTDDKPLEGCLSIPTMWGNVSRPKSITLKYQDLEGNSHEELFEGFMATIIQHETDHTNGVLFTQRVIEQHGTFYKSVIDAHGKEVLKEVTL